MTLVSCCEGKRGRGDNEIVKIVNFVNRLEERKQRRSYNVPLTPYNRSPFCFAGHRKAEKITEGYALPISRGV